MKKILLTLLCILIGPFVTWRGLADVLTGWHAQSWPTVPGTIQSTDLATSRSTKGRLMYTPVIKYQYQVAGTTYTGDRVNNGDRGTRSQGDAMATVERYRGQTAVTVHYDPKMPQTAFLEAGATGDNWFLLGVGMLMILIGIANGQAAYRSLTSNSLAPSSGF